MDGITKHDWAYYDSRVRKSDSDWLRSLTPDDRMDICEDMFNLIRSAHTEIGGDWARLDLWNWEQKATLRQRMVEVFHKLDALQIAQAASNNAG